MLASVKLRAVLPYKLIWKRSFARSKFKILRILLQILMHIQGAHFSPHLLCSLSENMRIINWRERKRGKRKEKSRVSHAKWMIGYKQERIEENSTKDTMPNRYIHVQGITQSFHII